MEIRWDLAKNQQLKKNRGVSFEELMQSKLIAIKEHPAKSHQNIMLFEYQDYVWVVPYVKKEENEIFLKTLYPSRKYTKAYQRGELE